MKLAILDPIVKQIQTLTIKNSAEMTKAVEALSQCNKYLDKLTEEKEKLTKPINSALKEIRSRYKPAEEKLNIAIATIRSKMSAYQTEATRVQKEQEQKIADKVFKGTLKVTTAMNKLSSIVQAETQVSTDSGSVKFRTVKKFEITDPNLIPKEYLMPDESKIKEAMKTDIKIPGITYFEEQVPANYR